MKRALPCLLAAVLGSSLCHAQSYPNRVVKVMVGYPAGGSIDVVGRIVSQTLSESMGHQFVVENRSGASGTIATVAVVTAPPDGYTLLVGAQASLSGAVSLIAKLPYEPTRDVSPIALIANQPNVLIVHPSVPARTTKEFIALAKANPGKFTYGSSGIGATQHLSTELFAIMTGTRLVHVPYKGGAPAMVDLIGGQIDFTFAPVPTAGPYINAKKVRPIAVTFSRRTESLPTVPTLDESGLPGYDFGGYIGLLGPAKMPRDLVMKLNGEVSKATTNAAVRKQLIEMGLDVPGGTPEQFAEFIRQDIAKCAKIVAAAKIAPQ
jgi:tripartite-type tricarboxylate transporter receptor subunit TctC